MTAIGLLRHVVTFQTLQSVPDGDGGFTESWTDLPDPWPADVRPASIRDLERLTAGTIVATATHVIECRYRRDVTVDARMTFDGRTFTITGVKNVDERGITLQLFAYERL